MPGGTKIAILEAIDCAIIKNNLGGVIVEDVTKRSSKNAVDAGEFYVAYMLSRLGISAALTTSGTSAVDIIATIDGSKALVFR
ncbi:hypothetical protein [Klebsiella pneumoniae]|uniref:hypothetical protein n=1 Tax=Klebsiella pneumoniae TaxID=573 RepID=UPI001D1051CC|nr:hypothetical protein [Klebsiella pneumoniae]